MVYLKELRVSKKSNYCIFCGSPIPVYGISRGAYLENACLEPGCPHYGTESGSEYENLEGFSIIDLSEVDDADDF